MRSNEDFFDIYNVDDLPEVIRKNLCRNENSWQSKILKLFDLVERPLSVDEIFVAYYRIYNEIIDKQKLANQIWQLTKRYGQYIEKVKGKKGLYMKRSVENDKGTAGI